MSLDAYVRDGRAKPHPLAGRFVFDKANSPSLAGDPSEEQWELHDHWVQESCEHEGFLVSESLGNIMRAQHLREFLRADCRGEPGPKFPVLLKKVVYDGTHTGDWIEVNQSPALLREVDLVLASRDILTEGEKGILPEHEATVRGESDRVLRSMTLLPRTPAGLRG